ncbi:hypothetical protein UFOVP239_29 [uncultured Caudovirales phage]|uniref:Uncharacterized protein n=1 Tax=uncultured Caudovirales phage TaxID=2100421 RepID=A0A6J7WQG9_9CAUD|nr:hypothetical protein UFOVP239_29 [uncultured Caudovirales phage]
MNKLQQAAQQALEFLEALGENYWLDRQGVMAALREALAEPEQKPVAHCTLEQLAWLQRVVPSTSTIGLYISPPQHKPLKDGSIDCLFGLNHFHTIEKAHGIGGKE